MEQQTHHEQKNGKKKKKLKFLLSEYAAEIVFGLNKAALFFKILPEKILAFKENKSI